VSLTNEDAIARWGAMPRAALEAMDEAGDFPKRHLVNPHVLRLLGELRGRRILDAGCGEGYFSRILAAAGAEVTAVEPGRALIDRAIELEAQRSQGIRYIEANLTALPDLGGPFDAVLCSMVLPAIPDWRPAMRSCVEAVAPGGTFIFTTNHPCFEQLWTTWREHGAYQTSRYLQEYDLSLQHGWDRHRTISTYLNEVAALGCRIREIVEPGLDPAVAESSGIEGIESYVHLPNFLIVAAERA
jgi:2-polyprenyl-3-methyl-5-hydroxy-6-metoxy-1,4-benzoquinol methylase